MTRRELEQIRPWLDSERRPTDDGSVPSVGLKRKGYVRHVIDGFYELTEKGQQEAEQLIGRPL